MDRFIDTRLLEDLNEEERSALRNLIGAAVMVITDGASTDEQRACAAQEIKDLERLLRSHRRTVESL